MKIAVIGGAGVRTVIFINGLLKRYKKLHIDEVVLYDIQEEKQRIIEKLCKHVVERNHEELKVWAVSDPVEAITGADYIVTTLRVGGDHSRVVDETIALDLGVIGQETTGVGGFSMAVRTIPVLMEYCELIKKYAPKYNVLLRDDKTYPYIKVTLSEDYPRIVKTRRIEKDGDKYFGPYSDAGAVNQMIDLLNKIYRFKRCPASRFPA